MSYVKLVPVLLVMATAAQAAPVSVQGQLHRAGFPVNEPVTVRATIYDGLTGGTVLAGPITTSDVAVDAGIFAFDLDLDPSLWPNPAEHFVLFEIQGDGEGSFTTMSPRQRVTPSSRAVRSLSAMDSPVHTAASFDDVAFTAVETLLGATTLTADGPGTVHASVTGLFDATGIVRYSQWILNCLETTGIYYGGAEFVLEIEDADGIRRHTPSLMDFSRSLTNAVAESRRPFGLTATFDTETAGDVTVRVYARGLSDVNPDTDCVQSSQQDGLTIEFESGSASAHLSATHYPEAS